MRREIVDFIDKLLASRNGDRKTIQLIRITSRHENKGKKLIN